MRGGHLFHVVDFAVGGLAAIVRVSVPTSEASFNHVAGLSIFGRQNRMRWGGSARNGDSRQVFFLGAGGRESYCANEQ